MQLDKDIKYQSLEQLIHYDINVKLDTLIYKDVEHEDAIAKLTEDTNALKTNNEELSKIFKELKTNNENLMSKLNSIDQRLHSLECNAQGPSSFNQNDIIKLENVKVNFLYLNFN